MRPDCCVIMVAAKDAEEGNALANQLVKQGLAACVQQLPIRSTYRWDGEVVNDSEILLLIKTTQARYDDVERVVSETHSYDVPEILRVDLAGGSGPYVAWLRESVVPLPPDGC